MDKTAFWKIIEDSKFISSSSYERPVVQRAALEKLSPDEIQDFQEAYISLVYNAYTWPMWGAAYVMNDGSSEEALTILEIG